MSRGRANPARAMSGIRVRLQAACASLVLCVAVQAWADAGQITKEVTVRAEPSHQAQAVGTLPKDVSVEILKTERWWLQVRAAGTQGWVPVFYVRGGGAERKPGLASEAAGVVGLATGRQGSGQVTSVIGIRGLNEEELKGAHFSEPQLKQLETFAVSAEDGGKFARQGRLAPVQADYIEAPAVVRTGPGSGSFGEQ